MLSAGHGGGELAGCGSTGPDELSYSAKIWIAGTQIHFLCAVDERRI